MDTLQAIKQRTSKRAFLNTPVSRELITKLLEAAGRAPSALNLQPWEITVVGGPERLRLGKMLLKAYHERSIGCSPGSDAPLPEHIKQRQYSSFLGLTEHLQLDSAGVLAFINKGSLDFYGAPTALIITKENLFPERYLTSLGIMIGYLVLAAEAMGLATCPVGLINSYQDLVLDFLNLEEHQLVLGLALGYADPDAPVNRLRTPREPLENLVRWYD